MQYCSTGCDDEAKEARGWIPPLLKPSVEGFRMQLLFKPSEEGFSSAHAGVGRSCNLDDAETHFISIKVMVQEKKNRPSPPAEAD